MRRSLHEYESSRKWGCLGWMAISGFLAAPAAAQCPPQWLTGEGIPGVSSTVYATMAWDPDGPGPRSEVLVVGGSFTIAGDITAGNIACWDPATSAWSTLGTGIGGSVNPYVWALTALNGKLYAGGLFSTAGGSAASRIACWDPAMQTWSSLGSGVDGGVHSLTVLDGKVYVGGSFRTAGGTSARGIACWDPVTQTWSALGSGVTGPESPGVYALTTLDGSLYAGGGFTTAGGVSARNIARWDPVTQTWSALGSGIAPSGWPYPAVNALAVFDNRLYVGGTFNEAASAIGNGVACWDPATSTWSALGSGTGGTDGYVHCLAVLDGKLYAGGVFSTAGGQIANRIASWDPATLSWSTLGSGINASVNSSVESLTVLDSTLFVGGCFTAAGGQVAQNWARWVTAPQADFDCDLDVDSDDLGIFGACATGPGILYDPLQLPFGCTLVPDLQERIAADFDDDKDVDQSDFAIFQRCISGAGIPANPACKP
jgi:hypothetical protein